MPADKKHNKISSLHDISLAKERCRYNILLQEQALTTSSRQLGSSFKTTFRNSMIQLGSLVAATATRRLIQSRLRR